MLENHSESLYAELLATLEEATPLAEAPAIASITDKLIAPTVKKQFKRPWPHKQTQGGLPLAPEQLREGAYESARRLRLSEEDAKRLADAMKSVITSEVPLSRKNFLAKTQSRSSILEQMRLDRLHQARAAFALAFTALVLGIVLIFVGIIFTLVVGLSVGIVTASSSVVVELVSALAFKFNSDTNQRLDAVSKELHIIEETLLAEEFIERISDPKEKDAALQELIRRMSSSAQDTASGSLGVQHRSQQ